MGTAPPDAGSVQAMNDGLVGRSPVFESLSESQCLEYLGTRDLGRVAFQVDRQVDAFPVNYCCDGQVVVFRTAWGSRLHRSRLLPVTFEADSWDPETRLGWSVVLKGVTRDVTDGVDVFSRDLRQSNVVPVAPGKRELWMALFPSEITGRRFGALAKSR